MRNKRSTTYLIRNQTPRNLVIENADRTVKLAPLQKRPVNNDPGELFGKAGQAARRDHVLDWEIQPVRSKRILTTACLAGVGISALIAGAIAALWTDRFLLFLIGFAVSALCAGVGVVVIRLGRNEAERAASRRKHNDLDVTPDGESTLDLLRDFAIATSQGLVVVLLIFVGVAAPACAIYYGTELSTVIQFHGWNNAPTFVKGAGSFYIVVVRSIQLFLLIIVCLVPALMYFQFDRERLTTMIDRWLHAIFRLDGNLATITDVDAKYGRRVEEYFGAALGSGVSPPRKRLRDRSPVIVSTLLIAIGWILVLLNAGKSGDPLPAPQELFRPAPTPMTLAFLGAYFLSVQVALRGYVRGDLKPKTYNVITVRIIMAVVLAWSMQVLWGDGNDVVLVMSFLAGILPATVIRRIRDIPTPFLDKDDGELTVKSPLTELDEIDVYERTRLEEEGITSVQALARHDLVDLILSSRIPIPRIIDWVDQAALHQHVPDKLPMLRAIGVRTATDFLRVCEDPVTFAEVKLALNKQVDAVHLDLLRVVLEQEEWMPYIKSWRTNDGTGVVPTLTYTSGGAVSPLGSVSTPESERSSDANSSSALTS